MSTTDPDYMIIGHYLVTPYKGWGNDKVAVIDLNHPERRPFLMAQDEDPATNLREDGKRYYEAGRSYFRARDSKEAETPPPSETADGRPDTCGIVSLLDILIEQAVTAQGEPGSAKRKNAVELGQKVEGLTAARICLLLGEQFRSNPDNTNWTSEELAELFDRFALDHINYVLALGCVDNE